MIVRGCAAGVFVASLLACGGMGGPAPTERAIALAETRFRDRYAGDQEDDHAVAVGFGDSMVLDWVTYTPEQPTTRVVDGTSYLVVPYTWTSESPIVTEGIKMDAIAWGSNGAEVYHEHRESRETCSADGDLSPRGEGPYPPHYAGGVPNASGHCEFLFEMDAQFTDSVLFLLERDERVNVGQYIGHRRKEPWVMDLGAAIPE